MFKGQVGDTNVGGIEYLHSFLACKTIVVQLSAVTP